MKNLSKFAGPVVMLAAAWGACNASAATAAGGAVFQRTENTQSIELSNIEEEGAAQVPVSVETAAPQNGAKAAVQSAVKTPAQPAPAKAPAPAKTAKKKSAADGTEEEETAEGGEPLSRQAQADANRAADKDRNDNMLYSGGGMFNSATGVSSFGTGTETTGNTGNTITSGTSGSTSTSTGTSMGSGTGTSGSTTTAGTSGGTGSGSGTGTVPTAPTATTALDTKLESYRNQMLQEVVNAQVANPALTRRYQMMDKATYQSRGGL
jgi:hypothetical protein